MSGNGKNLSLMTEDEFVHADPEDTQRWTYRMFCALHSDMREMKRRAKISDKAWSFAGGVVGGVAAVLAAIKAKIITGGS